MIVRGWYGADVSRTGDLWSYRPKEPMTRQEMAAPLDSSMKTLGGGPNLAEAPGGQPRIRATWLWNSDALLTKEEEVFSFLRDNRINLIYLQIDPDLSAQEYGDFIAKAGMLGMEVHALGGAPDWIQPGSQGKMYKLIDWVKSYNSAARSRTAGSKEFIWTWSPLPCRLGSRTPIRCWDYGEIR
ncbi:hypothetical protein LJK87_29610 [Paenibacillus sp. P25]|nr:hypothetical protein LJK87_29610 [Paenibacillus sp. P25]